MSRIDDIRRATQNGLNVFHHELGSDWKPGRNFQNPFQSEKQSTPSFNVFQDEAGTWRYNDFATAEKGDCFDLVRQLHQLPLPEALGHIERALGLPTATDERARPFTSEQPALVVRTAPAKPPRAFAPIYRTELTAAELAFWGRSGVGPDVLEKYDVRALERYTAHRNDGRAYTVQATPENLLFGYNAGGGFTKTYAPRAEKRYKFTWPTGQPSGYTFGLAELSEWHPLILLAAGEKDAMTLSAHGYAAVTVGSESAPVSAELVARLKMHCDEVLVCYDADATGRKRAAEIGTEHGLRWVELPAELAPYGKDATDFYQAVYAGHLPASLLAEAVRNAKSPTPPPTTVVRSSPTRLRTARQRLDEAKNAPPLSSLFGPFWESPGVAILAGEPGAAKTLLGLHVAHAVSSSTPQLLGLACDACEKTLYYDLELTDRQFEKRLGPFPFTDNLIIGDYNPDGFDGAFTFAHIAADLEQTGAKLLIIDNITALSMKSTADADAAMAIMRGLKDLQRLKGISSLVIAHPPKLPPGVPLSLNHIGGSKHLTNFADSVFFIARSEQGPNLRYLKHVKNRTGEQLPGVLVCEIQQTATGLGFALIGPDEERNHLAQIEGAAEKPERGSAPAVEKLRALWLLNPATPQAKLAEQIECSVGFVNKHLGRIKAEQAAVHAAPGAVNA